MLGSKSLYITELISYRENNFAFRMVGTASYDAKIDSFAWCRDLNSRYKIFEQRTDFKSKKIIRQNLYKLYHRKLRRCLGQRLGVLHNFTIAITTTVCMLLL
jgi:hypothetical protein